jgi:hypothetical protein
MRQSESSIAKEDRLIRRSRMSEEDFSGHGNRHDRTSRNSRGGKEEFLTPTTDDDVNKTKDPRKLVIYFIAMVFIGLGNKIFVKLQTVS